MKVDCGYSQEHSDGKWSKHGVIVEEEDLKRMLVEAGLEPGIHMAPHLVWQLLTFEGESLLLASQLSKGLVTKDYVSVKMGELSKAKQSILKSIKEGTK